MTGPDRPLTIAEAAAALGLSAEGVRSRLRRGQLAGARHGRTWHVFLTGPAGHPVSADRSDRPLDRSAPPAPDVGAAALVAELRADVTFLRQALEREQAANAELRRLLAAQLPSLGAPVPAESRENGPASVAAVQKTPPRRFWRFWRR